MIKAKKSLGQNFLIDQNIIDKIVNLVNIRNKNISNPVSLIKAINFLEKN